MIDKDQTSSVPDAVARAGQWRLMWLKFRRNRLALTCGCILALLYVVTLLSGFIAPYDPDHRFKDREFVPPQRLHLRGEGGFGLHVQGLVPFKDPVSTRALYAVDPTRTTSVRLFVRGQVHSFLGLKTTWHLFGTDPRPEEGGEGIFLLGTDLQGRDVFSRVLYGGRISLTIGLVGVFLSVFLGSVMGIIAGYFGGIVDHLMQRAIEILRSFPRIPLWMALGAAIPADVGQVQSYFLITVILSILGWTGLARVVRGQVLSLREEEFVLSARLMGAKSPRVIFRHLLPGVMGHIIVVATIAIPGMILAESSLSFLGLGIRPPMVSWGALLKDCQSLMTLLYHRWLLVPALFIITAVFCFNFLGDGLRDAADPYSEVRR